MKVQVVFGEVVDDEKSGVPFKSRKIHFFLRVLQMVAGDARRLFCVAGFHVEFLKQQDCCESFKVSLSVSLIASIPRVSETGLSSDIEDFVDRVSWTICSIWMEGPVSRMPSTNSVILTYSCCCALVWTQGSLAVAVKPVLRTSESMVNFQTLGLCRRP